MLTYVQIQNKKNAINNSCEYWFYYRIRNDTKAQLGYKSNLFN